MTVRGTEGTLLNALRGPMPAVMSLPIVLPMGFGAALLGKRDNRYGRRNWRFDRIADSPAFRGATYAMDGAYGAHQHLRHHAVVRGAGHCHPAQPAPERDAWGAVPATGLPAQRRGRVVRAGGLVIVRQRPETAAHLLFLTLEDETGLANALVDAATYERLRPVLRGEPLLALEGPLQVRDGVTQIAVRRAWPLARPTAAPGPMVRSHDFR